METKPHDKQNESVELPTYINLLQFSAARATEISELRKQLSSTNGRKLIFQRLPRHMRRRAMSHNIKRLPRSLRGAHLKQMKQAGLPPKVKKPSRKYRRRPHNLLDVYCRRRLINKWLETHIWHAKRFHMVNKWGYRLAEKPCDKAFRACYRASVNHCLIEDVSYFGCVEISGHFNTLIEGFKNICDPNVGLGVCAKAYTKGNREGQAVFFDKKNNNKAVGTIYFHWKPQNGDENLLSRVLWLWIHPAFYTKTITLLTKRFELKCNNKIYINSKTNIQMRELKHNFNRFRLTGPLAFSILFNVLKIADTNNTNSEWFKLYLSKQNHKTLYNNQCNYWYNLKNSVSTSELSPHHILSLAVIDPRLFLAKKRIKAYSSMSSERGYIEPPQNSALGPIWDLKTRTEVKTTKITNEEIKKLRTQLLVPGNDLQIDGATVPVIIIQRPGIQDNRLGYTDGWDLIVPSGWGNTFWLSLIMWGGRPGGLRESEMIRYEAGEQQFLAPDTDAGNQEEHEISEKYEDSYFKLPPNKRPNFTKLGVIQPFRFKWRNIIASWNSNSENSFFVLRDKNLLDYIQKLLCGIKTAEYSNLDFNLNCLIPVQLTLESKGTAKKFARICLPKPEDLIIKSVILEPQKRDENEKIRKKLRFEHKICLKKYHKQRRKARNNKEQLPDNCDILKQFKTKMKNLWLPEISENDIRSYGSREVMGFVTNGNFSLIQGRSSAIGYITLGALKTFLDNKFNRKLLIRNINSRQYRIATFNVIR